MLHKVSSLLRQHCIKTCQAQVYGHRFFFEYSSTTARLLFQKVCHQNGCTRFCSNAVKHKSTSKNVNQMIKTSPEDIRRIRNIGVMAHIDAGKTTTTERMLYYSGFTRHLGDVDDGDTVTDYMEQERERGITITSAAVTFSWNKHTINLIDTPGHVDFTLEVERCLRVLDGVVTVLDASAGVEAQTLTVWRQADRYSLPRVVFLNKMDKPSANLESCMESIEKRLQVPSLLLHIPVNPGRGFSSIVDVLSLQVLHWDSDANNDGGKTYSCKPLLESQHGSLFTETMAAREKLLEQLVELDEKFAEVFLNGNTENVNSAQNISEAIRRITISNRAVPVLCGSSLRNIAVQPLLDAVVSYLPDPLWWKENTTLEKNHTETSSGTVQTGNSRNSRLAVHVQSSARYYGDDLCALAFKVIHDKHVGALTFVRVYSGLLSEGSSIYNVGKEMVEKPMKIYRMTADEYKPVQTASTGSIVALSGLKQTVTGDTLTSSSQMARAAVKHRSASSQKNKNSEQESLIDLSENDDTDSVILAGLTVPNPVVFCSVEPPSASKLRGLEEALARLIREDPSLSLRVDNETGQMILGGVGELHLEIIKDRILKEYGIDAYFGEMEIAYKESIVSTARDTASIERVIGDTRHRVTVSLSVSPASNVSHRNRRELAEIAGNFHIDADKDSPLWEKPLKRHHVKAIDAGIESGMGRGPLLGCGVLDTVVTLHNFSAAYGTSLPIITSCISQCVYSALSKASPMLLEPIVDLEVITDDTKLGSVLSDLSRRRAHILDVGGRHRTDESSDVTSKLITARAPLAELRSYASHLRTLTSGLASVSLLPAGYEPLNEDMCKKIVLQATGRWTG